MFRHRLVWHGAHVARLEGSQVRQGPQGEGASEGGIVSGQAGADGDVVGANSMKTLQVVDIAKLTESEKAQLRRDGFAV